MVTERGPGRGMDATNVEAAMRSTDLLCDRCGDERTVVSVGRVPDQRRRRRQHISPFDPQPNDVAVTVVTAVILLIVLCVTALL